MKKVIRLTESDLVRIVKRVIRESEDESPKSKKDKEFDMERKQYELLIKKYDNPDTIIRLLGGKRDAEKYLSHYKPLGITSVDELIEYKGGYPEDEYPEDEY
jgi:hypothetical protein